ncbi:hypothetical protein Pmani_039638 [Petrolisthes manimaculis]|uniref:Uncharacterized protein n=1 Tax=Petrolisthes manimaculis TaxID=1843537 RepID=A0AAE1NC57_9EUCA|nr:hypothetical protein Pmani_039638 [Petrolisthes manimaculis]
MSRCCLQDLPTTHLDPFLCPPALNTTSTDHPNFMTPFHYSRRSQNRFPLLGQRPSPSPHATPLDPFLMPLPSTPSPLSFSLSSSPSPPRSLALLVGSDLFYYLPRVDLPRSLIPI